MSTTRQHLPAAAITPPDRLNEDWRFGRPQSFARDLIARFNSPEASDDTGLLSCDAPTDWLCSQLPQDAFGGVSIGSGFIEGLALQRLSATLVLRIPENTDAEEHPIRIRCAARTLTCAGIHVEVLPGAHVHIIEEHEHTRDSALVALRSYTVHSGATLRLELRELGSGSSRALNISRISCAENSCVRQLTTYNHHLWAREETTALLSAPAADLLLLSANRLNGGEWLDQRTRQLHTSPGAKSRLLYKNIVDADATAIFGGNIRVQPDAHESDSYLSNLNLLLSPNATVHSLPGLEILADRVRCSHGSASAPIDPEQLFYLLSRGIDETEARAMLADAFLAEVHSLFNQA